MNSENFDVQFIIHSGKGQESKAVLGLATALAMVSAGAKVVVFFTLEAAVWADPANGKEKVIPSFDSVDNYMNLLYEMGAVFEGCTACVELHCSHLKDDKNSFNLRPGFRLAGLSTAAIRAMTIKTLTF